MDPAPCVTKTDLKIPGKLAFVLENVIPADYCKALIELSEQAGYEAATLTVEEGIQIEAPDTRNNARYIRDDEDIAGILFDLIKSFLPAEFESTGMIRRDLISLNERLRFLRYYPGQKFARHMDGWYARKSGERSWITVQFYLNEGFVGGETTFLLNNDLTRIPVVPKTGMALIFQHDIVHEGSILYEGTKYTIRTDVMYTNTLKKPL